MLIRILLGLSLISSFGFTQIKIYGDGTPIDEGLEKQVKIDPTKGITFENNSTITSTILSLAQEKEKIEIVFKNASHLPLYYQIVRVKKIIKTSPKSAISRDISFSIKKSLLEVGDKILFFNRRDEIIQELIIKP